MTTVELDASSLATAQSLAVGQIWKILAEEGASCINMSPWKPSVPAPDVLTGCWKCSTSLAALGLPWGCHGAAVQRGAGPPPEFSRRGLGRVSQPEWMLKGAEPRCCLGLLEFSIRWAAGILDGVA